MENLINIDIIGLSEKSGSPFFVERIADKTIMLVQHSCKLIKKHKYRNKTETFP